MALASKYNLDIDQMDAVRAFLQGDVEEQIYMRQPEGFDDGSGRVCLLRKALYGLKQASRQWNVKLNGVMIDSGYRRLKTDACIYIRRERSSMVIVAVYVDDLLIFSNHNAWKNQLKANLTKNFSMKDLGLAGSCIGMQITRDRKAGTISLDQQKYTEAIIEKFCMNDCNSIDSPVGPNTKLTKEMSANTNDELADMKDVPYQEAVGNILYLAQCTRPDITFAISNVSKFNNQPGRSHWNAVKRIFRYLKKTSDYKLTFGRMMKTMTFMGVVMLIGHRILMTENHVRAMFSSFKMVLFLGPVKNKQRLHFRVLKQNTWHSRWHLREHFGFVKHWANY